MLTCVDNAHTFNFMASVDYENIFTMKIFQIYDNRIPWLLHAHRKIALSGINLFVMFAGDILLLTDLHYTYSLVTFTIFPLSAPSAAQNVTASPNDTHILISWSEPASPNGVVTYSVEVVERDLLTNDNFTVATENMVTGLELAVNYTEEPYSEYTIVVTSQTGAGMGDPVSVSFQTPEEGKYINARSHTKQLKLDNQFPTE